MENIVVVTNVVVMESFFAVTAVVMKSFFAATVVVVATVVVFF
jgi:hypothetical protein